MLAWQESKDCLPSRWTAKASAGACVIPRGGGRRKHSPRGERGGPPRAGWSASMGGEAGGDLG
eukprot:11556749-Alexandrium_andersonii.AAC.1